MSERYPEDHREDWTKEDEKLEQYINRSDSQGHAGNILLSIGAFIGIGALLITMYGGGLPEPAHQKTNARERASVSEEKERVGEKAYVRIETERVKYHHLGDDMTFEYFCNGSEIEDGDVISVDDRRLSFKTRITEEDSSPDIGESSVTMRNPEPGKSVSCMVHIDESNGRRYPDAYADYRVTFSLEPG